MLNWLGLGIVKVVAWLVVTAGLSVLPWYWAAVLVVPALLVLLRIHAGVGTSDKLAEASVLYPLGPIERRWWWWLVSLFAVLLAFQIAWALFMVGLRGEVRQPTSTINFVVLTIWLPCLEELFFRGFVLQTLRRKFGPLAAIALSSVAFGLAHGPANAVETGVAGVGLAAAVLLIGSLNAAIAVHIAHNALIALLKLFAPNLSYEGSQAPLVTVAGSLAALALAGLAGLLRHGWARKRAKAAVTSPQGCAVPGASQSAPV